MKKRNQVIGMALVAAMAIGLNGCGGHKEDPKTSQEHVTVMQTAESGETTGKKEGTGTKVQTDGTEDTKEAFTGDVAEGSKQEGAGEKQTAPMDEALSQAIEADTETLPAEEAPTVSDVGLGSSTVIVNREDTEEVELSIDDESTMRLENMNFFVPLFTEDTPHDEAFQAEILRYGFVDLFNGGEEATLTDQAGNEINGYKVSEETAVSYYRNLLGEELTIKPEKPAEFGDTVPVYFEDGSYYIGIVETVGAGYMYHRAYQLGDKIYVTFYMYDDENTYSDYIFQIQWADNDNGFIVKAHYYEEQAGA